MAYNNQDVQQAVTNALADEKKKKKKKRLIIIAIIVVLIIIIAAVAGGGSDDDKSSSSNQGTSSSIKVDEKEEEKSTDGVIGDYVCTVKSAKLCKNYDGKDAVKITYSFTNNYTEAESFDLALSDDVYQDGIGLEMAYFSDEDQDTFDVKIKPGTTKEVSKIYVLNDKTTPLDIEIKELISFGNDKLTYTVELE